VQSENSTQAADEVKQMCRYANMHVAIQARFGLIRFTAQRLWLIAKANKMVVYVNPHI